MTFARWSMVVYAVVNAALGIAGTILSSTPQKLELMSAIGGTGIAFLTGIFVWVAGFNPRLGYSAQLLLCGIFGVKFAMRAIQKGAFWPQGLVAALAFGLAIILVASHFAAMAKRKAESTELPAA